MNKNPIHFCLPAYLDAFPSIYKLIKHTWPWHQWHENPQKDIFLNELKSLTLLTVKTSQTCTWGELYLQKKSSISSEQLPSEFTANLRKGGVWLPVLTFGSQVSSVCETEASSPHEPLRAEGSSLYFCSIPETHLKNVYYLLLWVYSTESRRPISEGGLDGWMGGWADGRMGGWMDGWIDGWKRGGLSVSYAYLITRSPRGAIQRLRST